MRTRPPTERGRETQEGHRDTGRTRRSPCVSGAEKDQDGWWEEGSEMVTETACNMRGRAWGRPRNRPQEGEGKKRKREMTTGLQDLEEKKAP